MRRSYLKGALIVLCFIFVISLVYGIYGTDSGVLFSPGGAIQKTWFDYFLLFFPLVLGILIVLLAFFLIMSNFE